jgi:hypothetical protein
LAIVFSLLATEGLCEEIFDLRYHDADVEIVGIAGTNLGAVVAAGDINGDGIDDIVTAENGGMAYIIYGDTSLAGVFDLGTDSADVRIVNVEVFRHPYSSPSACFGDINADGIKDLIISSLDGATYVIYGDVSLPAMIDAHTYPDVLKLVGAQHFFNAVGSGDFNADGFDDIILAGDIVRPPDSDGVEIFVKFGGENLLGVINFFSTPPDVHIEVTGSGRPACPSVCPTDINNDGFDDMIFSNIKYDGPTHTEYTGAVWVIYGDTILPSWINLDSSAADLSIYGDGRGSPCYVSAGYFGAGIGAGDVNGDGFNDLVIGAPVWGVPIDSGKAYVLYGDTILPQVMDLRDTTADVSIYGVERSFLGNVISTGDFNQDGCADILFGPQEWGAPQLSKVYMVIGGGSLPSQIYLASDFEGITIIGEQDWDLLGSDVAMGDFNEDGFSDMLIGASGSGKTYAIFGHTAINHGDANGDGVINVSDVVYLVNYLFIGGPPPCPLAAGDVNSDGITNVSDVVYLINYLFIGGPPPSC